jgi:hypothetical protein
MCVANYRDIVCDFCATVFQGKRGRKWCDGCQNVFSNAKKHKCEWCDKLFKIKGGKCAGRFCSKKCSGLYRRKNPRLNADGTPQLTRECKQRIKEEKQKFRSSKNGGRKVDRVLAEIERFLANDASKACKICERPTGSSARAFCSEPCRRESRLRKKRGTGSRKHTTRAKKRFLPLAYNITLRMVAERDCYTCQLCGCKTLESHVDGNPMSPSIDHIVPLGHPNNLLHGHTWDNVQLACRLCNETKNNRLHDETLLYVESPRDATLLARSRLNRQTAIKGGIGK